MKLLPVPALLLMAVALPACRRDPAGSSLSPQLRPWLTLWVQESMPGVRWGHGGGGGGTRDSQYNLRFDTAEPVAAEEHADLLGRLRKDLLARLAELGAEVRGTGTTGDGENLERLSLRYEFAGGVGWTAAWVVRQEDGRLALILSVTEHLD